MYTLLSLLFPKYFMKMERVELESLMNRRVTMRQFQLGLKSKYFEL